MESFHDFIQIDKSTQISGRNAKQDMNEAAK